MSLSHYVWSIYWWFFDHHTMRSEIIWPPLGLARIALSFVHIESDKFSFSMRIFIGQKLSPPVPISPFSMKLRIYVGWAFLKHTVYLWVDVGRWWRLGRGQCQYILRLWHLMSDEMLSLLLKVWRLSRYDDSWCVVHMRVITPAILPAIVWPSSWRSSLKRVCLVEQWVMRLVCPVRKDSFIYRGNLLLLR